MFWGGGRGARELSVRGGCWGSYRGQKRGTGYCFPRASGLAGGWDVMYGVLYGVLWRGKYSSE